MQRTMKAEALATYDKNMSWYYNFYNGPYPIYWSGLVAKGEPNQNAITFLSNLRRTEAVQEVVQAVAAMQADAG